MVSRTVLLNILGRTDLYEVVQARSATIKGDKLEEYLDKTCILFERGGRYRCTDCPVPDKPTDGLCMTEYCYLRMLSGTIMEDKDMFDEGRTELLSIVQNMSW